jgi:glycosyltransferase involved in cell wall biosynthesis
MRWPGAGLTRYLDGLLHAMAGALADDERLFVYYNSRAGARLFRGAAEERFIRMPNRTAWNQLRLPAAINRDRCDVYLGTAFVTPVALRRPCVPVVHDCLAFRDQAAKAGAEGRYWRRWTRAAVSRARRVIAVSRFVADDCRELLSVDEGRLRVVYPGVDRRFTPASDIPVERVGEDLSSRLGISGPYALHVGAFDRHKGAAALADAVRMLRVRGRRLTLVRCGPPGSFTSDDADVRDLGRVDDPTLLDLYRCASVVCVPSSHEGFGLPVVEAMACGAPVVTTRAAALPEAGGTAAVYADGADAVALAAAIGSVLDEPAAAKKERRSAGLAWSATFSWERAAQEVLGVLREAAAVGRPDRSRR